MLQVKLFGAGQAFYYDHPLSGFPAQQSGLVLAYLLLNRQAPVHREQLSAVFWGDYPTHTARKYLRNALWRLRQVLQSAGAPPDQYLLIYEESILFDVHSRYTLDVELFEDTAVRFQQVEPDALDAGDVQQLEHAVDLYAGDLLESVYADWCLYDRERLRLLYIGILKQLMAYHARQGAFERSLAFGQRVLVQDPTRENVHRHIMWLYWQLGDRNAALLQYKRCCQILREELDILPVELTRALYDDMLRNRVDPTPWPTRIRPVASLPAPVETKPLTALQPSAAQALQQRLLRLQTIIEETNAELRQIERLLNAAVGDTH